MGQREPNSSSRPYVEYEGHVGHEGSRRSSHRRNRVLVEDDPKIASFIQKGLRRVGPQADGVETGTEALARLDRGGVDLTILDLGLPEIGLRSTLGVVRG